MMKPQPLKTAFSKHILNLKSQSVFRTTVTAAAEAVTEAATARQSKWIGRWLGTCAGMCFGAVVIGPKLYLKFMPNMLIT